MGKKLDGLLCLGRNFKSSKFKSYVNLAISRIAFLEKQHRVRCQQARSDVVQLLNLGQNERALLRVEHVIREQNMLDAYVMIENYFNLLMERIVVLQNNKQCPEELKEAISSLIFAASRCGELPELQKIRGLFSSRYGKELQTRAVELRNNCGVNPKMVKKLSTRRPSLDSKLKMLKVVAPTHDISNLFEGGSSRIISDKETDTQKQQVKHEAKPQTTANLDTIKTKLEDDTRSLGFKLKMDENSSERKKDRKPYRDAASAAQAAYKFAADAAEAARAAVQLARPHRHSSQETNGTHSDESSKHTNKVEDSATWKDSKEEKNKGLNPYKMMTAMETLSSKQRRGQLSDDNNRSHHNESKERYKMPELEKFLEDLSFGSGSGSFTASLKIQDNTGSERNSIQLPKNLPSQVHPTIEGNSNIVNTYNKDSAEESGLSTHRPSFGRKPLSVRTRRSYRMRSMS